MDKYERVKASVHDMIQLWEHATGETVEILDPSYGDETDRLINGLVTHIWYAIHEDVTVTVDDLPEPLDTWYPLASEYDLRQGITAR